MCVNMLEIFLQTNLAVIVLCTVFMQVPPDTPELRKNVYYCTSCSQYLPSAEFHLSSNSKTVGRCRQCSKKTNEAITRQEHTQYTYILQNVWSTEEILGNKSKIAFLMKVVNTK